MGTFYIAQGNTAPAFEAALETPSGTAAILTGASVVLDTWDGAGTKVIDGQAAVVTDGPGGIVQYELSALETATPGIYKARWTVTYADGSIESFPSSGFDEVEVSGPPTGYQVSSAEVTSGFSTGASSSDIAGFLAIVDQADACLTAKGVSPAVGRQLKVLAVRHLLSNSTTTGGSNILSERAVSGASRTYKDKGSTGETGYLETLRTIDQYGCVMSVINKNAKVQLRAVGRRAPAV